MCCCTLRVVCVTAFPLPCFSNGHYPLLSASQSDNLLSYLTVEESLTFTAQLALRYHSAIEIHKKVSSSLEGHSNEDINSGLG